MSEQALGQHACPNGHPVRASARFCPACGTAIEHPVDETTMRDVHLQPPGSSWPADVQWPPAPVPAAPAPAPAAAGRSSWTWIALVAGLLVLAAGGGLLGVHVSRADTRPTANATPATPTATPTSGPTATPTGPRGTTPAPAPPNPGTTMMGVVDVTAVRGESHAQSVGYTLNEYFNGINQKDMPRVLAVMDPTGVVNRDNPRQVEQFRVNISTTTDSNVVVHWIRAETATGGLLVGVTFTSRQEARFGPANQTCTNWSLTYVLSGQFLIVRTTGTYVAC